MDRLEWSALLMLIAALFGFLGWVGWALNYGGVA